MSIRRKGKYELMKQSLVTWLRFKMGSANILITCLYSFIIKISLWSLSSKQDRFSSVWDEPSSVLPSFEVHLPTASSIELQPTNIYLLTLSKEGSFFFPKTPVSSSASPHLSSTTPSSLNWPLGSSLSPCRGSSPGILFSYPLACCLPCCPLWGQPSWHPYLKWPCSHSYSFFSCPAFILNIEKKSLISL